MLYLLTSNYGGDMAVVMHDVAAVVVLCEEGGDDARWWWCAMAEAVLLWCWYLALTLKCLSWTLGFIVYVDLVGEKECKVKKIGGRNPAQYSNEKSN